MRRIVSLFALLAAAPLTAMPLAAQDQVVPATDPARLAAAHVTVDHVFPVGTYRKLMGGNFSRMLEGISTQMLNMKVKDLIAMGGADQDGVAKMSDATMRQVMEIVDPAYEQRNKAMFTGMMAGMADIMNDFEPEIRNALTDAYAARFTTAQLKELNAFFATPTGTLYAQNAMSLSMDPAFMDKMMKLTPRLMQAMPKIAQDAMAKTGDLPPRRSYAALSQADKDKLATILALPPAETARALDALEKQQKKRETAAQ